MSGVENPEFACFFHSTNFFLSHSNFAAKQTDERTVTRMKAKKMTKAIGRWTERWCIHFKDKTVSVDDDAATEKNRNFNRRRF